MPSLTNIFAGILDLGGQTIGEAQFFEKRIENNAGGSILYVGWSPTPNAPTSGASWMIVKMGYDGNGYLDRVQMPDDGVKFGYIWDNNSSYFS